jgi:hypothetical protein
VTKGATAFSARTIVEFLSAVASATNGFHEEVDEGDD